jgi:hypothetical protein
VEKMIEDIAAWSAIIDRNKNSTRVTGSKSNKNKDTTPFIFVP